MPGNLIFESYGNQNLPGFVKYDPSWNLGPLANGVIDIALQPDDPNHIDSGMGWVHLSAILFRNILNRSMANTEVVIDIEIENWARQGDGLFGLWIQAFEPRLHRGHGRTVNLFQIANPICTQVGLLRPGQQSYPQTGWTPAQRRTVTIPFSSKWTDWASMGTSDARKATYGEWEQPYEMSLQNCLDNWLDWGFIFIEKDQTPHPYGKITFHSVKVYETEI